jgi:hypothetical protein
MFDAKIMAETSRIDGTVIVVVVGCDDATIIIATILRWRS